MKRDAFKLLAEKYQEVNEASGEQAFNAVEKLIEINPALNSIEVQTHYGNIVLPIVEIWKQDGVIKISVDHSQLEKLYNT